MPQTPLGNMGINYEHTLGADDWKNSYDTNWVVTDWSLQPFILNSLAAEPGSPAVGDAYILVGSPTGTNWGSDSGAVADSVAIYTNVPGQTDDSPWYYMVPREGWRVYDRTNNYYLVWDGSNWVRTNDFIRVRSLGDQGGDYTLNRQLDANADLHLTSGFDEGNDSIVIESNANQPFPLGTCIRIYNQSGGNLTFTDNASVSWTGEDPTSWTTGLPNGGVVELVKVGTDQWWLADVKASGTHATTLTGFGTPPSITIRFTRNGDNITFHIPSTTPATSNATTMALTAALPVFCRPLTTQKANCRVQNTGTPAFGTVEITTAGQMNFTFGAGSTLGNFTASGNKSTHSSSVSVTRN